MTPKERKEERRAAAAIARAVAEDVALAVRKELEDAVKRGLPYALFAKSFRGILAKHGWWGSKDQIDPKSGLPIDTPNKIPARVKIVIQTNTRAARAAAQWTMIKRQKSKLPLLQYTHGDPATDRPEHVPYWSKPIILPIDHPFWAIANPPNGYNCTCGVQQLAPGPVTKEVDLPERITVKGYATYPGVDPTFAYNPGVDRLEGLKRAGILRRTKKQRDPK